MPTMFTRGLRLEVAQDVLGALIAHGAEAAAVERDAAKPDPGQLDEIQKFEISVGVRPSELLIARRLIYSPFPPKPRDSRPDALPMRHCSVRGTRAMPSSQPIRELTRWSRWFRGVVWV